MTPAGANLSKRMQLSRSRTPEEFVPRIGTKPHNASKTRFDVTELHRANQPGEISAERTHSCEALALRLYADDQKDRGTGKG